MRTHAGFGLAALALAGCTAKAPVVLGAEPPAGAPVVAVRDLRASGSEVVLRGRMVEKCPVAGCWFILRDKSGAIKVDTREAGFVVTEVPLETEVTVVGTFKNSVERLVSARGVRL